MSTVSEGMDAARNGGFQDRVRYAATSAALAVMSEANTTPSHAERVAYAKAVLAGNVDFLGLTIGVVSNPSILAELAPGAADFGVPDGDIQFAINSVFGAYAGVST